MKNFYVTYKFKNAKDRSEFLREVKPYAQISRQEEGCVDMTIIIRQSRILSFCYGNSGRLQAARKNI